MARRKRGEVEILEIAEDEGLQREAETLDPVAITQAAYERLRVELAGEGGTFPPWDDLAMHVKMQYLDATDHVLAGTPRTRYEEIVREIAPAK